LCLKKTLEVRGQIRHIVPARRHRRRKAQPIRTILLIPVKISLLQPLFQMGKPENASGKTMKDFHGNAQRQNVYL